MTGNPKLEARRARLAGLRLLENNTHGARIWKHCHWCVHSSAGQALKVVSLIDCISVGGRADAAKFRTLMPVKAKISPVNAVYSP